MVTLPHQAVMSFRNENLFALQLFLEQFCKNWFHLTLTTMNVHCVSNIFFPKIFKNKSLRYSIIGQMHGLSQSLILVNWNQFQQRRLTDYIIFAYIFERFIRGKKKSHKIRVLGIVLEKLYLFLFCCQKKNVFRSFLNTPIIHCWYHASFSVNCLNSSTFAEYTKHKCTKYSRWMDWTGIPI